MREIATACGLSQAGLLHHFASKEAILLAIVEYRETHQSDDPDAAGSAELNWQHGVLRQVRINEENEALTRLRANLVGEAMDPAHPAHEYFKNRYRGLRAAHTGCQAEEHRRKDATAEDFDMKPAFEYALKMLSEYSAE